MALNVPQAELVAEIGHDGGEILWPDLDDPFRRRAFHVQEFIWPALKRGYALTMVEAIPVLGVNRPSGPDFHEVKTTAEVMPKFFKIFKGVIFCNIGGTMHAVAWDTKQCYDPNGWLYGLDKLFIRDFAALIPAQIKSA